jgi:hypothetical protein
MLPRELGRMRAGLVGVVWNRNHSSMFYALLELPIVGGKEVGTAVFVVWKITLLASYRRKERSVAF